MTIKKRILHIDDHQIFRDSLKRLISTEEDFEVALDLGTTKNVLDLIKTSEIDFLILDINIDHVDICLFIKRIKAKYPKLPVIALSIHTDIFIIKNVLRSGASAYVSKKSGYEELVKALDSVNTNRQFLCGETSGLIATSIVQDQTKLHDKLTFREFHILRLLADGMTINGIANSLNLSPKTVSSHKANLMTKMRFESNAELVKYYIKNIRHN